MARGRMDVTSEAKNVNNQYLSASQLVDRLQGWKRVARRAQLDAFNLRKKSAALVKNLTIDKRILLLMSQENIPGIRRVLAGALKRGSSNFAILGQLERALSGRYHARGYSEDDNDQAVLLLRLGGTPLLNVMSKTTGLPGLSHARRHAAKVSNSSFFFRPCGCCRILLQLCYRHLRICHRCVLDNVSTFSELASLTTVNRFVTADHVRRLCFWRPRKH